MHAHPTLLGEAKCREITQGMVNLASECKPDGDGSFTCHPNEKANCFGCHAVSITRETLALIDIQKMKTGKKDTEILGHGCMTCHPPMGNRDHHLRGNLLAITKRAGKTFQAGCGRCHAEGLKKLTSGGSPHDWLARHLMGRP